MIICEIVCLGQKLQEAWFHKGAAALRVPGTEAPALPTIRAEAIIAFLLINSYLREDFHYTAYSTISYIKKGILIESGIFLC